MKASETKLQRVIEGTNQYVVPLFQRPYSWDTKEWSVLWDDLVELYEEEIPRTHFIGSIVTIPAQSVPEGVAKFSLIDGQQRFTTTFLLLAAIRDKAKLQPETGTLAQEIDQTLLKNPFKQGNEAFKLLPTQSDRESFLGIIRGEAITNGSQIAKGYRFFEKRLRAPGMENLEKLKQVVVSNLVLVSIVLDRDDNPHLVFESLNAKGRVLSQADLIRNYFFMKIHVNEQEEHYAALWKPMQDKLGEDLTEFIRHFLMKDGGVVKQGEVYFALKDRADAKSPKEIIGYLAEISRYADLYSKLLHPERESNATLAKQLTLLNRIEVTTAYPFLLNVYQDYTVGSLLESQFSEVLTILENFLVRRYVCSVPTNDLNKMFPALYGQVKQQIDFIEGLKESLRTKRYPKDVEFRERLITSKLYGRSERIERSKIILERLEESFEHREQVSFDELQIEHVMPQTLTHSWKSALGENWETTYELLLHTLGNLTLTGYNQTLSNDDYGVKKENLRQSHLELNKYFNGIAAWDEQAIRQRAEILAERALKVWKYFCKEQVEEPLLLQGVTGTTPKLLFIMGQRFEVSSWREVEQITFEAIAEVNEESFEKIAAQFPRFVGLDSNRFRATRKLKNGFFIETHLSAADIKRICILVTEAAGLSQEDWRVECAETEKLATESDTDESSYDLRPSSELYQVREIIRKARKPLPLAEILSQLGIAKETGNTGKYASLRGSISGYAKEGKVFTIESISPHVVGLIEFKNK